MSSISPSEAKSLVAELKAWKASDAGKAAASIDGLIPPPTTAPPAAMAPYLAGSNVSYSELQRFKYAKKTIAILKKEQPTATFSTATPFALLTADEFARWVGRSDVKNSRPLSVHSRPLSVHSRPLSVHSSRSFNNAEVAESENEVTVASPANNESVSNGAEMGVDGRNLATTSNDVAYPTSIPTSVDWQREGCVTRVKNQAYNCLSCWVFAAVGALESGYCIYASTPWNRHPLISLSELEAGTCSTTSSICDRGDPSTVFNSIISKYHGVCTEASSPYILPPPLSSSTFPYPKCPFNSPSFTCKMRYLPVVGISGQSYPNHQDLEKVVAKQPVVAVLHSGVPSFQYYTGGILKGDENKCSSSIFDHAVLMVGYGTADNVKYWKLKNSWGKFWGDKGYVRLERGYQGATYGACGIERYASYPRFRNPITAPQCQPVEKNKYFVGNNIVSATAYTPEECCDRCSSNNMCSAYSWAHTSNGGKCYLKRFRGNNIQKWTPRADGTPRIVSGEVYKCKKLQRNKVFVGVIAGVVSATHVSECCAKCRQTYGCAGFTFKNKQCQLKRSGYTVENANVAGYVSAAV